MFFESKYKVGVREIGKNNKISNIGILGFLEEIAAEHSSFIGYGINDIPNTKITWILLNWHVKILERPIYGEVLNVKTWSRLPEKKGAFIYRDFEIYCNEKKIAKATSKWVMINIESGKIARITTEIEEKYKSENKSVFIEREINKLQELQKYDIDTIYKIRESDIDINGHVHNLNYLNIAYEILPKDVCINELNNIEIMYKHEIAANIQVKCLYKKIENVHQIAIKSEDENVLYAILKLE